MCACVYQQVEKVLIGRSRVGRNRKWGVCIKAKRWWYLGEPARRGTGKRRRLEWEQTIVFLGPLWDPFSKITQKIRRMSREVESGNQCCLYRLLGSVQCTVWCIGGLGWKAHLNKASLALSPRAWLEPHLHSCLHLKRAPNGPLIPVTCITSQSILNSESSMALSLSLPSLFLSQIQLSSVKNK